MHAWACADAHALAWPALSTELGIDIPSILMKTKAILLHQMKASTLDDLDFGGALVFLLALGCLHLMVRELHQKARLAAAGST